jgi:NADH-quinone oxidoreductase subunit J
MSDILFYVFAALTLLCGFLVVLNPFSRNPVTSAMFLVLTIVSLAGLFVLLEAFFLAAVQVLVYAGAVMVLFLFVIMVLDLRAEERRRLKRFAVGTGVVAAATIATTAIVTVLRSQPGLSPSGPVTEGATGPLGELLFRQYLLPFELVGILLVVAMVGVVLLSKKEVK